MLKVSNKDITSEQRHYRLSNIFIVNFEHVSQFVLVFLLLTLNKYLFAGGGDIILEIYNEITVAKPFMTEAVII